MSEKEPGRFEEEGVRTSFEVEQDIRDAYASALKNQNLGQEVIIEAINDLDSSKSWGEFAQKQQINVLRIEPGSNSEKIMNFVKEYYELKKKEEGE